MVVRGQQHCRHASPGAGCFFSRRRRQRDVLGLLFIDNAGQAFHGETSQLTLDRCVVQRCQTVGQFNGGSVTIRDSALLDFPSDSDTFEDGDNDALYFTLGEHEITGTLIGLSLIHI